MYRIANLFHTNIRKFDAKKKLFFLPRILRHCKSLAKLIFFKNKVSVREIEL